MWQGEGLSDGGSSSFEEYYFAADWHVVAFGYYHLACMLLILYKPTPRFAIRSAHSGHQAQILEHARAMYHSCDSQRCDIIPLPKLIRPRRLISLQFISSIILPLTVGPISVFSSLNTADHRAVSLLAQVGFHELPFALHSSLPQLQLLTSITQCRPATHILSSRTVSLLSFQSKTRAKSL
jgi:hypothetical protein